MIRNILIGIGVVAAGFVGLVAMQPSEMRVERSALVHASPEVVFDQLDDFEAWHTWQPWAELDPNMKRTVTGPKSGVGAAYSWEGNDDVGKGSMEILEATPGALVKYDLKFITPFEAENITQIALAPEGDATRATWTMTGTNNFGAKMAGLFIDMDAAIGTDFERGLAKLDTVSKAATDRIAKRKAAETALAKAAAEATDAEATGAE